MTPFEIAMLAGGALAGVLSTLGVIRLAGKAPPSGDKLRAVKPPPLPPSKPSER